MTASATSALIDRLFTIDWKVKAVRNVSPLRREDDDQDNQQDRQVPDREEPRQRWRAGWIVLGHRAVIRASLLTLFRPHPRPAPSVAPG